MYAGEVERLFPGSLAAAQQPGVSTPLPTLFELIFLTMDLALALHAKTVGACLAPFDCFLLERGIKTLAVRLEKQAANAEKIAHWLRRRPEVRKVYYIGFQDHPGYEITKRQCSGFGGMLSMEVDSPETARRVLKEVKLFQ